jgi:rsbT co-antagonist protein RsbR
MSDMIPVERTRLTRLRDVLSVLLSGNLTKDAIRFEEGEGELAEIDTMMMIFVQEYIDAIAANARLEAERLQTIERQRVTIEELRTPIIEVWKDVLALPIVGNVDAERSTEMTERLLARIIEHKARVVIVDITGVELVDTMTARHLVQMMNAARMLGSRCIVSGMSPAVAQTLAELGDLLGVKTMRTLSDALRASVTGGKGDLT